MVAADEEGEGMCEEGCAEDQLLFSNATVEGECVSYDAIQCSHRGERAYAALDGTFECDCAEGWGRVGGEGDCKQEGTMCGENRCRLYFLTSLLFHPPCSRPGFNHSPAESCCQWSNPLGVATNASTLNPVRSSSGRWLAFD